MAIGVSYTVRDSKNATSDHTIYLPDATSLANVTDFAIAGALIIGNIITGGISRIGLVFEIDVPVLAGVNAQPGSDVEEGGRFSFATAQQNLTRIRLATLDEQYITEGSRDVDIADTNIDAFVDMMTTGLTVNGTLVQPVDSRDEEITSLRAAKESFLSSRNP